MNILRRLKNIWDLGQYRISGDSHMPMMIKESLSQKPKMATIIQEVKADILNEEITLHDSSR